MGNDVYEDTHLWIPVEELFCVKKLVLLITVQEHLKAFPQKLGNCVFQNPSEVWVNSF